MYIDEYDKNYRNYVEFINRYREASNAASGSEVDSNANVENKNVATCNGELTKRDKIGVNRLLMIDKLTKMYGEEMAEEYIRQLESHEIYKHDETSIYPYTYAATEVVSVSYKGKQYLVSMDRLYDLCDETETLVDSKKIVYIKYPQDMQIADRGQWTRVERLIRKLRHRDLVRVKTHCNNDIIVTDNHPMIVNDNIDDTVPASEAIGHQQYRVESPVEFGGQAFLDSKDIIAISDLNATEIENGYIVKEADNCPSYGAPKMIALDRDLGYLTGFFIGDGFYTVSANRCDYVQKEKEILLRLADIAYTHLGAAGCIKKDEDRYVLQFHNPLMHGMFHDVFAIKHTAAQKTLPENIFDYNQEFAIGVIEGIIDSDGTIDKGGQYNIRLSSRSAILQIGTLLDALKVPSSLMASQSPFGCNLKIKQRYQLFGITFRDTDTITFSGSKKSKFARPLKAVAHRKLEGWIDVASVSEMTNEAYLSQNDWIYDVTTESHTFICNGLWVHNCVSVTMYPFLFSGLKGLGGLSSAPTNLDSFCGSFINLVFAVAAQFAGAVATPEFLMYMDYFIRKDYGDDYPSKWHDSVTAPGVLRQRTMEDLIHDKFQQIIYSINQPAAARDFQSVFWNIAYFDRPYFHGMFDNFVFPDGTAPKWETLSFLQKEFMRWFNKERLREVLTFPVETMNLLNDGHQYVDGEYADLTAQMYAEGHSFFTYTSDSVDSLASCCRLRNEVQENTFSYTLGAGGVSTGSKGVITININRLVQDAVKAGKLIQDAVIEQVDKVHKYLLAYNEVVKDSLNAGLLGVYNAGYISMEKQYLTIGINGFVEGAEFLGIKIGPNKDYFNYGEMILKPIYEMNRAAKTDEIMFNTEFVPKMCGHLAA